MFSLITFLLERIDTDVNSLEHFDKNVETLGKHVRKILMHFAEDSKKMVRFKVGKSYVDRLGSIFNPSDASNWKWSGVAKRWQKYQNFNALVVFYAFTRDDVLACQHLVNHRMDNQSLALLYERAVEAWCEQDEFLSVLHTESKDPGGGGKMKRDEADGFVLYVAVTLADELACGCNTTNDNEIHACGECLVVACDQHLQNCGGCDIYKCKDHITEQYLSCIECEEEFCEECTSSGLSCSCGNYVCETCLVDIVANTCERCRDITCSHCLKVTISIYFFCFILDTGVQLPIYNCL